MRTWPYKNTLFSSEAERFKGLPVPSQRCLVCKGTSLLTLFFLWRVHLATIQEETEAFSWIFSYLTFVIQPPGAPFTLLLDIMHFLKCLEILQSFWSSYLSLFLTESLLVHCNGFYLELLLCKFKNNNFCSELLFFNMFVYILKLSHHCPCQNLL